MEEKNKTFIVKDEHIKSTIGTFKKCYTKEKELYDKGGVTPENMEKILEAFSGKNATLVIHCIVAIANLLPAEGIETIIDVLRSMLNVRLIEKIKEKMENSKS